MQNFEQGPLGPGDIKPDKSEPELDLDSEGLDTHPEEIRQSTRMDELKKDIERQYQEKLLKLEKYKEQIMHEFSLTPDDFERELKSGHSADESLDQLIQSFYKKRDQIEQDKKDAIEGLRQRLKEEMDEI